MQSFEKLLAQNQQWSADKKVHGPQFFEHLSKENFYGLVARTVSFLVKLLSMHNPMKLLFIEILLISLFRPILTISEFCSMRLTCCK